ncbi:hypothetical protein ACTXT7_012893, partial [Hymenolepis weldensis]
MTLYVFTKLLFIRILYDTTVFRSGSHSDVLVLLCLTRLSIPPFYNRLVSLKLHLQTRRHTLIMHRRLRCPLIIFVPH